MIAVFGKRGGRTGDFSPAKLLNLSIPAKKTASP